MDLYSNPNHLLRNIRHHTVIGKTSLIQKGEFKEIK